MGQHPFGGHRGGHAYLELCTDAGRLLLLVQVQQGLGGPVVQCHADDEPQGLGVQQVLGQTQRIGPALHGPQEMLAARRSTAQVQAACHTFSSTLRTGARAQVLPAYGRSGMGSRCHMAARAGDI